jgi:hypothetical protein
MMKPANEKSRFYTILVWAGRDAMKVLIES